MALYECTFITRPDITQSDVNKQIEKFSTIVTENGGKIVKSEYWGLRNLAYRIKKNKKGHYVMLGIDAAPAAMRELERNLGISEEVVRVLTVNVETLTEEPSIIMQQRSYGESSDETVSAPATPAPAEPTAQEAA